MPQDWQAEIDAFPSCSNCSVMVMMSKGTCIVLPKCELCYFIYLCHMAEGVELTLQCGDTLFITCLPLPPLLSSMSPIFPFKRQAWTIVLLHIYLLKQISIFWMDKMEQYFLYKANQSVKTLKITKAGWKSNKVITPNQGTHGCTLMHSQYLLN